MMVAMNNMKRTNDTTYGPIIVHFMPFDLSITSLFFYFGIFFNHLIEINLTKLFFYFPHRVYVVVNAIDYLFAFILYCLILNEIIVEYRRDFN